MSVAEAAAYLGLTQTTLYTYMKLGHLRWSRLTPGGHRRLRKADLDQLLEPGLVQPEPEPESIQPEPETEP